MVHECATMACNDDKCGVPSSASSDGVVAAGPQLGPVPADPGKYAEAEGLNAGQSEQVRLQVESSDTRS